MGGSYGTKIVKIENPDNLNLILGQSHFIKTVEDIYEAMVSTVPMAKFGLAFCEASDVCLVRHTGTDKEMLELAQKNAYSLSAGHSFIIFMKDMYPVNVLNAIKNVPEVWCRKYVAYFVLPPIPWKSLLLKRIRDEVYSASLTAFRPKESKPRKI
jgi:adenosine/AMP kinase